MIQTREHKLLLAVMICIGLLLSDHFLLTPFIRNWQDNAQEIAYLRGKLDRDNALLEQQERWQALNAEMENQYLPDDLSAAESKLITLVSQQATGSDLRLQMVRPQRISADKKQKHQELRLRITGKGELQAVIRFLYQLETAKIPLRINNTQIRATNGQGTEMELAMETSSIIIPNKEDR